MMIVMRGKIVEVIAVFMGTGSSRYRSGKADRAATHKGEHAQKYQNSPYQ